MRDAARDSDGSAWEHRLRRLFRDRGHGARLRAVHGAPRGGLTCRRCVLPSLRVTPWRSAARSGRSCRGRCGVRSAVADVRVYGACQPTVASTHPAGCAVRRLPRADRIRFAARRGANDRRARVSHSTSSCGCRLPRSLGTIRISLPRGAGRDRGGPGNQSLATKCALHVCLRAHGAGRARDRARRAGAYRRGRCANAPMDAILGGVRRDGGGRRGFADRHGAPRVCSRAICLYALRNIRDASPGAERARRALAAHARRRRAGLPRSDVRLLFSRPRRHGRRLSAPRRTAVLSLGQLRRRVARARCCRKGGGERRAAFRLALRSSRAARRFRPNGPRSSALHVGKRAGGGADTPLSGHHAPLVRRSRRGRIDYDSRAEKPLLEPAGANRA